MKRILKEIRLDKIAAVDSAVSGRGLVVIIKRAKVDEPPLEQIIDDFEKVKEVEANRREADANARAIRERAAALREQKPPSKEAIGTALNEYAGAECASG